LSGKPSDNRVVLALLRTGLCLALAISSYWALRLAWADHLSGGADLAGRERAVRLAPAVAVFTERLADRREELGGDSLPDLRRAAALDPENPERRMRLGVRAELAGDERLAEESLLAAAARSRLYQPKYLLAQYYFRRQDAGRFWPWARAALETAWGDPAPCIDSTRAVPLLMLSMSRAMRMRSSAATPATPLEYFSTYLPISGLLRSCSDGKVAISPPARS